MKRYLWLVMMLVAVPCFADNSKIEVRGTADDGEDVTSSSGLITKYFPSGNVQQNTVSLTASAFTAISVPSGAKAVLIDVMSTDGIKLKGLTGDQGISLDDSTPVLLGLSTDGTVTMGFQNMEPSNQQIKLFWF